MQKIKSDRGSYLVYLFYFYQFIIMFILDFFRKKIEKKKTKKIISIGICNCCEKKMKMSIKLSFLPVHIFCCNNKECGRYGLLQFSKNLMDKVNQK